MTRPNYPEGVILSVAKTSLATGRKFLDQMKPFGLEKSRLDELEVRIQDTEAQPDEMDNQTELKVLTATKDELLLGCIKWGKTIRRQMDLAFGKKSPEYKAFPAKQFNAAKGSEIRMMPVMDNLIALAKKYQSQLSRFGLTAETIQEGEALAENLRSADQVQEEKTGDKKMSTQQRYELFSYLVDTVNTMNKIGRLAFADDPPHLTLFDSPWPKHKSAADEPDVSEE